MRNEDREREKRTSGEPLNAKPVEVKMEPIVIDRKVLCDLGAGRMSGGPRSAGTMMFGIGKEDCEEAVDKSGALGNRTTWDESGVMMVHVILRNNGFRGRVYVIQKSIESR